VTTQALRLPIRRSDVLLHDEESRSVLLDPMEGVTHVLNPTARAVWELCDGATTMDEVVAAICQVFCVPHGVALRDIATVLEQLEKSGLVSWPPASEVSS
jgi:hypothetical protein